ncbi:MAG: NHL repeat-containing protein [Planctomycetes bacterium]|nr:NHL repeat-containing protein [Planctomycetota bacterium]
MRKLVWIGAVVLLLGIAAAGVFARKPIKRWWRSGGEPWHGRFQDPEGLAVDSEGNLYVADEDSSTFFMLDKTGAVLAQAKTLDGIPRLTAGDSMVVVEPRHLVIIGDHNLIEIRIEGRGVKPVRVISRRGHGEGEFEDPEGLARDANGDLYATDEDHRRIMVFGGDGRYLRMFKVEHDPEGICVTADRVYVTFSKDGYVGCYDKEGRLRFRFGDGVVREPDFAIVSPDGKLFVTDKRGSKIEVFDLEGRPLSTIGGEGKEPGRFDDPEDLAFDPDGNLVVADGGNHRIQVLTREGKVVRVIQ